jgi:threonine/homoserine/homoserine lactone efflux protein
MDLNLWAAFTLASFALAWMPGPDNIYVLTESLSRGVKQGIGITSGLVSGVVVHTTLVATGLSLLVFRYPSLYWAMKLLGTAYLLYMAYGAWREAPMQIEQGEPGKAEPFLTVFQRGFLMNVLNPKVSLFFIVLLPQFVSANGWSPMAQMMVLGVTFMVTAFIVFSGIALVSGVSASLVESPAFWMATRWIKVLVLIALALLMLFSDPN